MSSRVSNSIQKYDRLPSDQFIVTSIHQAAAVGPEPKCDPSQPQLNSMWDTRPQFYRQGNAGDLHWFHTPMQQPFYDDKLMSYDLDRWSTKDGDFKPEVAPDPCIPYHVRYRSFGKTPYQYIPPPHMIRLFSNEQCPFVGKSFVKDVACLDQQSLPNFKPLNVSIHWS